MLADRPSVDCKGVFYAFANERQNIKDLFTFGSDYAPVQYSVEGSGNVRVWVSSTRNTRPTKTLSTSTAAPVHLETGSGTSKVTAQIRGVLPTSATTIFIYHGPPGTSPSMQIVGEAIRGGAQGGRLEEYLEVKVTDGNGRPISGVAVQFDDRDTPADNGTFIPVPVTKSLRQ